VLGGTKPPPYIPNQGSPHTPTKRPLIQLTSPQKPSPPPGNPRPPYERDLLTAPTHANPPTY
jgi:hypothetical protein